MPADYTKMKVAELKEALQAKVWPTNVLSVEVFAFHTNQ